MERPFKLRSFVKSPCFAILHNLRVLLKHRPDPARPAQGAGVEVEIGRAEDVDVDEVEQVLLAHLYLILENKYILLDSNG